jgi:hypothetical protein
MTGDETARGESTPLVVRHASSEEDLLWHSLHPALTTQPSGVRGSVYETNPDAIKLIADRMGKNRGGGIVILPSNAYYQIWWHATVAGAILTMFTTPYQVAFEESRGFLKHLADFLEKVLTVLFAADIFVNFNLASYKDETILLDRGRIAVEYYRGPFWIDFAGVFPFAWVASYCAGILGASYESTLLLSLLRLLQIVRTRRLAKFADDLRYDARVGLLMYTLIRDFMVVVISCHFQACVMYFLARYNHFDDGTWLGPRVHHNESSLEAYVTSFYMCVTTFCTVGYGDVSRSLFNHSSTFSSNYTDIVFSSFHLRTFWKKVLGAFSCS